MVKAQVPAGKRGKAGGVRVAGDAAAAEAVLGMEIAGHLGALATEVGDFPV